jgi:hypothetical protein
LSQRREDTLPSISDAAEAIAQDVFAVGQIEAVPTLLRVLCSMTGMRFAAVARVTEKTWTICAVRDDINFELKPGGIWHTNLSLTSMLLFGVYIRKLLGQMT